MLAIAEHERAQTMKRILVLLFIVVTSNKVVHADTWARPVAKLYLSENKQYIAQVIPAKDENPATLKVFLVRDREDWVLWNCTLGNEGAPQDVFVADDGKYVVTVNENNKRHHGAFFFFFFAFYKRGGIVKNYSLEQILHYPDKIDQQQFMGLTDRTVSGRYWASRPMFLDEYQGKLYFCAWLDKGMRWLAWEVTSGDEATLNNDMLEHWDHKGLLWARQYDMQSGGYYSALRFIDRFKKSEDRRIFESLLTSKDFYTRYETRDRKFVRFYSRSSRRSVAEAFLTGWDGHPAETDSRPDQTYYYLGVVEGTIILPRAPEAGDRWLCVYLVHETVGMSEWYSSVPVHRLASSFGKYFLYNQQWPGSSIPFVIQGVTPGKYRIKAVWDNAGPYTFEDNYIKGPPQDGDYVSVESPVIVVKAGEKVENVIVDCTHSVSN